MFFALTSINKVYSQDTIFLIDYIHNTQIRDSANYFKVIKKEENNYQYTIYTIDGSLHTKGNLSSINPEIKEGIEKRFFRDGRIYSSGNYINNEEDGNWFYYNYLKEYIEYKKVFKDGKKIKNTISYYENGKVKREIFLKDRSGKKDKCYDESGNIIECEEYADEIMPKFNGDLSEYISLRMYYPSECKKNKIEGKVEVKFYIDIDGSVHGVHIIKSVHPLIDQQAVDIISKMPNWTPGIQREKYVRVYYTLPLNYKLN